MEKEITMWQEVTNIGKKKQAVTIYFALKGKACDACIEISKEKLLSDDDVNKIINKLDGLSWGIVFWTIVVDIPLINFYLSKSITPRNK